MNSKRLNDELTIIGLILVLAYALFTSYQYSAKLLEAKKTVILLDTKLTKAEIKIDKVSTKLEYTNESITQLKEDIQEYQYLEDLKKDIDRNLWPKQ